MKLSRREGIKSMNIRKMFLYILALMIILCIGKYSLDKNQVPKKRADLRVVYSWYGTRNKDSTKQITIDRIVKEGERVLLEWDFGFYIEMIISEISEEGVLVNFKTLYMVHNYDWFYENVDIDGIYTWNDELKNNECYGIDAYESQLSVLLTFNIAEEDKNRICGWNSKAIFVWESGDDYEFSMFKDRRWVIEVFEWAALRSNPISYKEIQEYMKKEECDTCVGLLYMKEANEAGYVETRYLTYEEFIKISSLYPDLPYCIEQYNPERYENK